MPLDPQKSLGQNLLATPAGPWLRFVGNLPFVFIGAIPAGIIFASAANLERTFGSTTSGTLAFVGLGIWISGYVISKRMFGRWWYQQTRAVRIISSTWHHGSELAPPPPQAPTGSTANAFDLSKLHWPKIVFLGLAAIVFGLIYQSYVADQQRRVELALFERQQAEKRAERDRRDAQRAEKADRERAERQQREEAERQAILDQQRRKEAAQEERERLASLQREREDETHREAIRREKESQADLKICNKTACKIFYARISQQPGLGGFVIEGWWSIGAFDCVTFTAYKGRYFWRAESACDTSTWGGNAMKCISPNRYSRFEPYDSPSYTCQGDEQLLGFRQIEISGDEVRDIQ